MSRVTLTNPFDLLGDENEDRSTNVPAQKKEQKPAAPAAKPAAKPAAVAKPAAKQEAKAPAKPAEAKHASKPSGNSANQAVRPGPPRDSNQNLQERDKETRAPRDKRDRPPRPSGDGSKRDRVFDRKSGTGRPKNEQSRGGHGRGNWGGETDPKEGAEALKEKEAKVGDEKEEGEDKEEKPAVEGEKKEGEAAKEGDAPAAPKEKEEVTYEEYLKSRKGKAPPVEALKPRQVTDTDFKDFVPLKREEAPVAPTKKEKKEKPAAEKKEAAPADKAAAEKEAGLAAKLLTFASHQDVKRQERSSYRNYDDNRRGSNDRKGSNKGPRGPRPERGDKGANAASQPPVQAKDFPALGPHGSESVKA